VATGA
jgi:hypothetical protein